MTRQQKFLFRTHQLRLFFNFQLVAQSALAGKNKLENNRFNRFFRIKDRSEEPRSYNTIYQHRAYAVTGITVSEIQIA